MRNFLTCVVQVLDVDDPHSKNDISKLLVDLYSGKKGATIARGKKQPTSTNYCCQFFTM